MLVMFCLKSILYFGMANANPDSWGRRGTQLTIQTLIQTSIWQFEKTSKRLIVLPNVVQMYLPYGSGFP